MIFLRLLKFLNPLYLIKLPFNSWIFMPLWAVMILVFFIVAIKLFMGGHIGGGIFAIICLVVSALIIIRFLLKRRYKHKFLKALAEEANVANSISNDTKPSSVPAYGMPPPPPPPGKPYGTPIVDNIPPKPPTKPKPIDRNTLIKAGYNVMSPEKLAELKNKVNNAKGMGKKKKSKMRVKRKTR